MGFKMPDLIVEACLRDGFRNARRNPEIVDDVFEDLTRAYASKKYGEAEITRIKNLLTEKEVSVVHAFNLVPANLPCISLQLADDRENEARAHMGNFTGMREVAKTTPADLAALVIVSAFTPTSYDTLSGAVRVGDDVNLASAYANLLFVDAAGTEHQILGGIVNDTGAKQFVIAAGADVDLGAGAEIKSSIDYYLQKRNGNIEQTQIIIGIHTKEPLTTKYLYILVKYFILSRRADLIRRGLQISTYQGSDFNRDLNYSADAVYTRFFHITATQQNIWTQDLVQLVDNVQVTVKVAKDRLGNADLGLTNATVQVEE